MRTNLITKIMPIILLLIEGINSIDLGLRSSQGKWVQCVDLKTNSHYCLTGRSNNILEGRPFKCYFNDELVYSCSSDGKCRDSGLLSGTTIPKLLHKDCNGIPFGDVMTNFIGNYICVIDAVPEFLEVHYDLQFCDESEILPIRLLRNNEEAKCFNGTLVNIEKYCLDIGWENDTLYPQFKCWLDGTLVYECKKNYDSNICSAFGKLEDMVESDLHTHPKDPKRFYCDKCKGILFATLDKSVMGNFTCSAATGGAPLIGSYILETCQKNMTTQSNTSLANNDGDDTSYVAYSSIVLPLFIIGLAIIIIVMCICMFKNPAHTKGIMMRYVKGSNGEPSVSDDKVTSKGSKLELLEDDESFQSSNPLLPKPNDDESIFKKSNPESLNENGLQTSDPLVLKQKSDEIIFRGSSAESLVENATQTSDPLILKQKSDDDSIIRRNKKNRKDILGENDHDSDSIVSKEECGDEATITATEISIEID